MESIEQFEKERREILQTKVGHIAMDYYYLWCGYEVTNQREWLFMHSRYFSIFVKFARHVLDNPIDDPHEFVDIMRLEAISPSLWRTDEAHQLYNIRKTAL